MHQNKKPVFFPNLDGLRLFCFLSVFFYHSFFTRYEYIKTNKLYSWIKFGVFENGNLGVNFFFVLSGFLITYLLLAEKTNYGKVHIGKFYIRRILKIWPLFYFCVFFGVVVFQMIKGYVGASGTETAHPVFYLLLVNNFDYIKYGADSSVLSILWSVAIEEQFYLVWPFLIAFCPRRLMPYAFFLLLTGSFIFRFLYSHHAAILELHTFSCISDMVVGGCGAYLAFYSSRFIQLIKRLPKYFIVMVYVGVALLYGFRHQIFQFTPATIALDRLVISVFFLFIILEQNYADHSFYKMSAYKTLSKWGQYTYGLYCLHMIGILIVATVLQRINFNTRVWQVLLVEGLGSLALTLALAYVSFHVYEKRFLLLKKKLAFINTGKAVSELNEEKTTVSPIL
jgi:peptidoglycan/LPS O-acetylase OafA/YrhL